MGVKCVTGDVSADTKCVTGYVPVTHPPLPGRVRDFHPLERAHGAHTQNAEVENGLCVFRYKPAILQFHILIFFQASTPMASIRCYFFHNAPLCLGLWKMSSYFDPIWWFLKSLWDLFLQNAVVMPKIRLYRHRSAGSGARRLHASRLHASTPHASTPPRPRLRARASAPAARRRPDRVCHGIRPRDTLHKMCQEIRPRDTS